MPAAGTGDGRVLIEMFSSSWEKDRVFFGGLTNKPYITS